MKPNDFLTSHLYHSITGNEAQVKHLVYLKTFKSSLVFIAEESLGSSMKEVTKKHWLLLLLDSSFAWMRFACMKIYLRSKSVSAKSACSSYRVHWAL